MSEELFEKRSLPTLPASFDVKDPWCDVCILTRFMAEMCKVKSPAEMGKGGGVILLGLCAHCGC